MFMRFLQFKINSEFTAEFERFYKDTVMPQLQKVPGCLFAGLIRHKPEENEFASLTFWKEQEDAENYEQSGVFQGLVDKARPFLSESNEWKINLSDDMQLEYEPVAEEPVIKKYSVADSGNSPDKLDIKSSSIYIRIVSVKVQAGKADEFKDLFHTEVIPVLRSTKGCRDIS
jgi:quinol monooxygenase YgiN